MSVVFLNFIRSASGRQPRSDKISHDLISYDLPKMTLTACSVIFVNFQLDNYSTACIPDKATIVKMRQN